MNSQHYRHQIICLNNANQPGYQLHVSQIAEQGQPPHHAQWKFHTLKGLLAFLRKHFPDSELLHQEGTRYVRFQVAWGQSNPVVTLPTHREKIAAIEPDRTSQFYLGLAIGSTPLDAVKTSCA